MLEKFNEFVRDVGKMSTEDAQKMLLWVFAVIMVSIIIGVISAKRRINKLRRYLRVSIGMPEDEVMVIMGRGYARSLLKDGRTKYEWRIEATSYGTSYRGHSTRAYSGVKKVDIYIKNGVVEEVKSLNI